MERLTFHSPTTPPPAPSTTTPALGTFIPWPETQTVPALKPAPGGQGENVPQRNQLPIAEPIAANQQTQPTQGTADPLVRAGSPDPAHLPTPGPACSTMIEIDRFCSTLRGLHRSTPPLGYIGIPRRRSMSMSEPAPHPTSGPHGIFDQAPANAPYFAHASTHSEQDSRPSSAPGPQSPASLRFLSKTIRARKSGSRPAGVHVGDNNG